MENILKVKVIGAGPTGSILAMALASIGISVDLYDPIDLDIISSQQRSYAITHSTRNFFEKIGLWKEIIHIINPFENLLVSDQYLKKNNIFTVHDLHADNLKHEAIGWIVEHTELMRVVSSYLYKSNHINLIKESSTILNNEDYFLSIATDGKQSTARKLLNIPFTSFKYDQACITFQCLLRGTSASYAYEILRKEGPLAILPLKGDLYQIVWSAPLEVCIKRMELSRSIFLDRFAGALPINLEPDCIVGKRRLSKLDFTVSFNLCKGDKILIGEASHSIHPVGGQGLNLSIRDINCIFKKNAGFTKLMIQ